MGKWNQEYKEKFVDLKGKGKVKIGSYAIAGRDLGAHLRRLAPGAWKR